MVKSFTPLAYSSIFVGLLLILENFDIIPSISNWWPLFPLFIGVGMAYLFYERGADDLILVGMASYIILVSFFFFYLNIVGWVKLVRFWPIFIGLLGLSLFTVAFWGSWKKIYALLAFFLTGLSVLLFVTFSVDVRLWPLSLILFGISILLIIQGEIR